MKLRLLPIIISVFVTSVVLFGGWFAYQSIAQDNPMSRLLNQVHGVKVADIQFTRTELKLRLELDEQASLREIYEQITTDGASIIGDRKVNIEITNSTSKELEQIWSSLLFDVAQAMETKHYADIPTALNGLKERYPQVTAHTEMDDTNVYVRISNGNVSKFVILPRIPARMEAWTNE